jgi:hypothetical protein
MEITRLVPRERIVLDRAPIEEMCRTLGTERTEVLVGSAMEEIAMWMARSEKLCRQGNRDELGRIARLSATVGGKLGMRQLARVGDELADLVARADEVTLAALAARLSRVGEGSLVAVWELQGLSV